jgi:hypothetical protein
LPVSFYLCFEHVDNLGAYSIPPETGLLIPSDNSNWEAKDGTNVMDLRVEI